MASSQLLQALALDLISRLAWLLLFCVPKDKGSFHKENDRICHMQNVSCRTGAEKMWPLPMLKQRKYI